MFLAVETFSKVTECTGYLGVDVWLAILEMIVMRN